jgi:ubiquinone/menaquinone biosynthesis C-methylase UbiE
MKSDKERVCPVELAGSLDSKIRRWFQNPQKVLTPYIKEGMSVLDIGCGPGFFSIEIAKIVGQKGKVFAADLQEGMLQKIKKKIAGTELEKIIRLHKTGEDKINLPEKVDFIFAFYVIHEIPNKENLFKEFKNILSENGRILIVEPIGHVSGKAFEAMLIIAKNTRFETNRGGKVLLSRSAILTHVKK